MYYPIHEGTYTEDGYVISNISSYSKEKYEYTKV